MECCVAASSTPQKPKLTEFHVMRIGATPAKLVAFVRATDEQAALAEVIARNRIPPHMSKAPDRVEHRVRTIVDAEKK